jgi:hypothetical protein
LALPAALTASKLAAARPSIDQPMPLPGRRTLAKAALPPVPAA